MFELELKGCRSQPLMSYLKALAVLRLVSEQVDGQAVAAWHNETLLLRSSLAKADLIAFFRDHYIPTPIVGPWAGGSGFFGNDDRSAVNALGGSSVTRLGPYRSVIETVHRILADKGFEVKPSEENKADLLRSYRRQLPDDFVRWMDCVMVLQADGQSFPPLLGTGGNDGRLDFTRNFMQRLVDLGIHLDVAVMPKELTKQSESFLGNSLFGEPCTDLFKSAVGQFHPGGVGGPNAGQGMEGESLVNPWDFILMLEGALVMAGALTRRMGVDSRGKAVFPFTVFATQVGDGGMGRADEKTARGEVWMPLWNRFAGLPEISLVFSEGRAELSGRQCRNGLELARAVSNLGVDRGLSGFVRYGFLKRSGKAFLATPLGRFDVTLRPRIDLLRDLENRGWLGSFRTACADKNTPSRFTAALRKLDASILDYCRYGGDTFFPVIFRALGQIERELALLPGRPVGGKEVRPVPSLSPEWISACDFGSREFRIAVALASIQKKGEVGSLSAHLEQVDRNQAVTQWTGQTGQEVWKSRSLCQNLLAVLQRRLMDADRYALEGLPLDADCPANLDDIVSFLEGQTDDLKIEQYLWSAILVRRPSMPIPLRVDDTGRRPVSRAYCALKLLFLSSSSALRSEADGKPIRPDPTILTHLKADNVIQALSVTARRLRVSGYVPIPGPLSSGKARAMECAERVSPIRLAAALLIPIQARDTGEVKRTALREKSA